jgi:hypothetical protein
MIASNLIFCFKLFMNMILSYIVILRYLIFVITFPYYFIERRD